MRKSLDIKIIRQGKILYNAIKSNYVFNYKCVLNRISYTYELRTLIQNTSNINWSNEPLIIYITNLKKWTKSYDNYITNAFKSTMSSAQTRIRIPLNDYTMIHIYRVL